MVAGALKVCISFVLLRRQWPQILFSYETRNGIHAPPYTSLFVHCFTSIFYFINFIIFICISGGATTGSLPVLSSAVFSKWASFCSGLYACGHARNPRVCSAGSHQRFHNYSCHGYEIFEHRSQVNLPKLSN